MSFLPVLLLLSFVLTPPLHGADTPVTDREIENAIETELLTEEGVAFDPIDVAVTDGVAILSGTVDNLLAEHRALRITRAVRGVESVVDEITVDPPEITDSELATDVEAALLADPVTESYEVETEVHQGIVTLKGTVESWAERRLAERIVKGISGVAGTDNQIEVAYPDERPDGEITAEVEERLAWDVRVDDSLIEASVEEGRVTLTGTVGSAAEKRQARLDAFVNGVDSVDVTGLEVARWARDRDLRESKLVVKPDETIEDALRDALVYDPRVLATDLEITVDRGIATLRGSVDNLRAKSAAEQTARNTIGVWSVRNRLKVRPDEAT
ncbi:MAG: BON domain-containing protein, partial [Thermoanaerobaculia bacterium]|nr:BON domain-containing protein [Thermoanaerobaculia bacterium]